MPRFVHRWRLAAGLALIAATAATSQPTLDRPTTPDEPIRLFDGRTFLNWKFVSREPGVDAGAIWTVRDGVIHCAGKPAGYARTAVTFRNYALHVEWRWPEAPGNSGVFVHVTEPDKVWPACLEVQLKAGDAGSIRANGGSKVRELNPAAKDPINVARRTPGTENPPGAWNMCDVECRGDTLTVSINGVRQNEVTGASLTSGAIGLQAEGAPVEFRNLIVRPLPPR